jgi:hypothetical protein
VRQLPGLSVVTYTAEPGATDTDRIALLGAWVSNH